MKIVNYLGMDKVPGQGFKLLINWILARGLGYRITEDAIPRIGLRGTAKVYGEKVSLFYYLFRRPITYLRQHLGW